MGEQEELRPLIFDELELGRDTTVNSIRWSCATEHIHDLLERFDQRAIDNGRTPDDVTAAEVCVMALEQAGERGILDEMYRNFRKFTAVDPADEEVCREGASVNTLDHVRCENDSRGAWLQILDAADYDRPSTGIPIRDREENRPTGGYHATTCALAMDAGYRLGIENPAFDPRPDLTLADVASHIPACLAAGSTLAPSDGLIIGLELAQAHRAGIDLVEAGSVPDARTAAARER